MEAIDSLDTKHSKQRASVKWLLSKAFNNRVPDNLLEPFYRDHEDQEHLKPPIIGGLANAELYCLALANIYSDPNYHNLNHWNILQTLTRKGITVETPSDCALTETVLIQTNPLRMNAHMHVIEAIMCLYSKEVVTWERVNAAVQRFTATPVSLPSTDSAVEGGLLVWINSACSALNDAQLSESELPQVAPVTSLQEVCDGTALAALISFYCPDALPRSRLRVGKVTSLQDCLHNLMAVYEFCANHLPHNIFHMLPEDVAYMRGSMRQNLIVLLSDLFNMLELHPVKCVKYPSSEIGLANSNEHGVMLSRRCLPPPQQQPIPDLRPDLDSESTFKVSVTTAARGRAAGRSACSTPEGRGCSPQRDFTVHKNKPIPTLSNVASDMTPAGRPSSRCDEGRSYSGRRSRRSSITDDSQLTLENFGGSQDRLNFLGRNPEKELATVNSMRKISAPAGAVVQNTPVRSTLQDARGSIHFFYDDYDTVPTYEDKRPGEIKFTQQQTNDSFPTIKRQLSSDNISTYRPINRSDESGFYLNSNSADLLDGDIGNNKLASFADINNMRSKREQSGIESVYSNQIENNSGVRRKSTTFAQSPNITTWQQQSMQQEIQHNGAMADENLSDPDQTAMASQLNNIRLKLEEKRRRILREKQRMEAALGQQRAQMGQQAFLQAVARSKGDGGSDTPVETPHKTIIEAPEIQDIDIKSVENKWLEHDAVNRTPDVDALGYDEYHQSIAQMNSSLQELQTDISRLANQQIQLQSNQFFSPPPKPQPTSFQPSAQNFSPQNPYFSQQNNPNFNPQKHTNFIPQNSQNFSPQNNQIFQSSPHLVSNNNISQNYPSPQSYETNSFHLNQNSNLNHQNSYQSNRQSFQPNLIHNQNLKKIDYDHQSYVQNQEQYERNSIAQNMNPLHNAYSAHNVSTPPRLISSSSQPLVTQAMEPNGHFYLHESSPQRRTWTHKVQTHNDDRNWQSPSPQRSSSRDSPIRSWKSPSPPPPSSRDPWNPQPGFLLHDPDERSSHKADGETRPYRRIALEELENNSGAAVTAPPEDVMEPQNISFISSGVARLNITSGSRTYRIPETTRRQRTAAEGEDDQGFYISLDDEGPRRPKPQLRPRRGGVGEGSRTTPPGRASPPPSASHPPRTKSPDNDFLLKTKIVQRNTNSDSAALIIGDLENVDPESVEEMEKKKERIILLSLQRRQRAEDARARAEQAAASRRTKELALAEQKAHRRAEQSRRREEILQQHKLKKAIEEAEREGKNIDQSKLLQRQHSTAGSSSTSGGGGTARMRRNQGARAARPRTIHVDASAALQRSTSNLTAYGSASMRRDYYRGSQDSLSTLHYRDSPAEDSRGVSPGANSNNALGRRGSYKTSREHTSDVESTGSGRSKYSTFQNNLKTGRKSSSLMNLCDSGLGRATPRGKSPGGARTLPSPSSGPGSLPHHRVRRHNPADDSDTASNHSSMADYSGPRLYKQPTTKSNRGIMLNAVEYCVFPGAVNKEAKRRVLEEIARSESKHFLVLFRDAGCQFRALYSYCPESENVIKLYGTGPRSVNDRMFDKFFKYNSGSKCFSQVHTKHLTVTIDAFTIHNSLWQGKKVQLPSKKDMALVI